MTHPFEPKAAYPSRTDREAFISTYGGVFEHSPWIAERAFDGQLGPANDSAAGLHAALSKTFRAASEAERLGVLKAHPDLAGRLAAARQLTADSSAEQAAAGLDALTAGEHAAFTQLNAAYQDKFGFPFIIAVKGKSKSEILTAFQTRIANSRQIEFVTACGEVEQIALLRLKDKLPD
jgi:OHCU decarboxylase